MTHDTEYRVVLNSHLFFSTFSSQSSHKMPVLLLIGHPSNTNVSVEGGGAASSSAMLSHTPVPTRVLLPSDLSPDTPFLVGRLPENCDM